MSRVTIESITRNIVLNGRTQVRVYAKATQYEKAGRFGVEIKAGSETWVYPERNADGQFSFIPDLSLLKGVQGSSKVIGQITVRYYEDQIETGSASEAVEIRADGSICKPEVSPGWVSIVPDNSAGGYPDGIYVKGSALKVTFSTDLVSLKHYATLAGYRVQIGGVVENIYEATALVGIPDSGSLEVVCTAIDSRGFTVGETFTINALAYSQPVISGISIFRADSTGKADERGAYIAVQANAGIADLGGNNRISEFTAKVSQTGSTGITAQGELQSGVQSVIGGSIVPARSYKLTITLRDTCGGSATYTVIIPTMKAAFNIMPGGKGAAFNKMSERDSALDLDTWDLVTEGNIEAGDAIFSGDIAAEIATFKEVNASNLMTPLDAYPVGSIYMSVNSESPAQLFGGTWAQLKDMFLLAAGDTYAAGSTGGAAEHTLTVDEMPAHEHTPIDSTFYFNTTRGGLGGSTIARKELALDSSSSVWAITQTKNGNDDLGSSSKTSSVGGGKPFGTMPPYIAVYVWQRTA